METCLISLKLKAIKIDLQNANLSSHIEHLNLRKNKLNLCKLLFDMALGLIL